MTVRYYWPFSYQKVPFASVKARLSDSGIQKF
jgi:hypothetical protein